MTDPDDAYLAREARARREIDKQLAAAGWTVQGKNEIDVNAAYGVATREFPLEKPHGRVRVLRDSSDDYLLALARSGDAEAMVTGDKDLLEHAGLQPCDGRQSVGYFWIEDRPPAAAYDQVVETSDVALLLAGWRGGRRPRSRLGGSRRSRR